MHDQDLAQTYFSLKQPGTTSRLQSTNTRSSSQTEKKNLNSYGSSPNEGNYLKAQLGQNQIIQNILGYPVTQAIVDEQGNTILDIGDLITHQAVERAIKANVFKILLDAVYIRK